MFGAKEIVESNGKTTRIPIAIKKIPVTYEEDEYLINLNNVKDIKPKDIAKLNSDILTELYFLNLTTKLLKNKVTNNLPFLYKWYLCNECSINNKRLIEKHKSDKIPCMYLLTEKANGDFEHFMLKKDTTHQDIYSAYLQIYIGLYVIKKYFGIEHQDLHIGNVLYFNVKPGGYWKYKIKNKDIYVPNTGILFILWDFGYSCIPELVGAKSNIKIYKNNDKYIFEDHRRIIEGLTHKNKRFNDIQDFLETLLYKSKSIEDIVYKLYAQIIKLYPLPKSIKVIEHFDTNKKLN
jgi:hypothetical protein